MTSDDQRELERLFPFIREYQALATRHGIGDVFQDNGGKLLQMLLALDLQGLRGREGNDAKDAEGNEYELKSVNLLLTRSFSTHHHLNPVILEKYRTVAAWYFGVYFGIELQVIYRMTPDLLEPYFAKWEKAWHDSGGKDRNNPKIPVKFVLAHGELIVHHGDSVELVRQAASKKRVLKTKRRTRTPTDQPEGGTA